MLRGGVCWVIRWVSRQMVKGEKACKQEETV